MVEETTTTLLNQINPTVHPSSLKIEGEISMQPTLAAQEILPRIPSRCCCLRPLGSPLLRACGMTMMRGAILAALQPAVGVSRGCETASRWGCPWCCCLGTVRTGVDECRTGADHHRTAADHRNVARRTGAGEHRTGADHHHCTGADHHRCATDEWRLGAAGWPGDIGLRRVCVCAGCVCVGAGCVCAGLRRGGRRRCMGLGGGE
mmetsp:Transcript_26580/g.51793  ORF Transcript_26580/g.51793 Transcript_26580/m.51793 type:complete len:205 (-) Transcript_26580:274-888(-)